LRKSEFERAAVRLTGYYVLGVAVILCVSSVAIFFLVSSTMPLSPEREVEQEDKIEVSHEELSLTEFREHLVDTLVVVDVSILLVATVLAYFFARRTLRPIETLYRAQERSVADVAHELRTPLSVLKAGSETLLRKERTSGEYRTFIQETKEETDRLVRLSNELLLLLAEGRMTESAFEQVALFDCAKQQVAHFVPYAEKAHVSLLCEGDARAAIKGVPDSMVRMCQNLIKNAIDYTRPGGSVQVSVREEENKIIFRVHDTGIGISPEEQSKIFNRFYKVDGARTSSAHSGAGLGLAIVQDIVAAHKGDIHLESTVGVGTTIQIVFPKASS